jgi:calmodulin
LIFRNKKLRTPQEQEKEMRDAFKALDKDSNGKILEAELRQILGALGDALSSQEVNALMREIKVDVNGGVDYSAFVDRLVNGYPVGDKL